MSKVKNDKILFVIESGGKVPKLKQILGDEYIVKPSFGHIMDLPKDTLGIDIENNFSANYIINPDKKQLVKDLKSLAKECNDVYIASDNDKEGEAIAQNLYDVIQPKKYKRIIFNEITKPAIMKAIKEHTIINEHIVSSQKCRRLLDRIIGYLISPILWKFLGSQAKSCGRVQSIGLRIIIDKEEEINKSISQPYFKTTISFTNKLNAVLFNKDGEKHNFPSYEECITFLKQFNKKTKFKVIDITNKKSKRGPSPPFITSSLQQEASSKLHFSVKKTTEIAQKLYEKGLITYIRTDSPNISETAISEIEKYVIATWSQEYSNPTQYKSKNINAQEAHEGIRPTHIKDEIPSDLIPDELKLYTLIWKRTVASQMAHAEIDVQCIQIDAFNNKESILEDNYFYTTVEDIVFPGFLIVYDNRQNDTETDEEKNNKITINEDDKLIFDKMKIIEEYTKPPSRYNEASLIKYLEKHSIGRPSTYSSFITKILDREYVQIKDVEGIKKESKQLELTNKYIINESVKEVFIGKESKKIVSTLEGQKVNNFMVKNFDKIINVNYTAQLEVLLDKIAEGKARWDTILRTLYNDFSPIIEQLNKEAKEIKIISGSSTNKLLGIHNDIEIYTGTGKYGPYVKNNNKYASIKDTDFTIDTITLDNAIKLLEYPKELGKIGNSIVTLHKSHTDDGFYIKYNGKNIAIKDKDANIDLDYCREIVKNYQSNDAIQSFKVKNIIINVKSGNYGPYIQILSKNGKTENISIPKKYNSDKITIDQVMEIISLKKKNI